MSLEMSPDKESPCSLSRVRMPEGWMEDGGDGGCGDNTQPRGTPYHTLPSRSLSAMDLATLCCDNLECSLRHKRSHNSPSVVCMRLPREGVRLRNGGAHPPGGLRAPQPLHPQVLAQERVRCVLTLGHEPRSQQFGAEFPSDADLLHDPRQVT